MDKNRVMNPFEYEAAVKFATDSLIEYFVEDHNYSRFIQSARNIFIVGERGCGKSMMLLYNSFQKQIRKAEVEHVDYDYSNIGIYVPCNNPLFFKKEYDLINNQFKNSILSEHFFVLSLAYELSNALSLIPELFTDEEEHQFRQDLNYVLNIVTPDSQNVMLGLNKFFQKTISETQIEINNSEDHFSNRCVSFYSLIIPLIKLLKQISRLRNSHFIFLIDDAHDLNTHQVKALNSWIAYRDHVDFSFKVAIAKVRQHSYLTANGSSILEGHDFLKIDLEKPFQNKFSDFGQWAKDIVERRLEKHGIKNVDATSFFPANDKFLEELRECEERVRHKAEKLFAGAENKSKKISDYVYKYARAEYFRSRPAQANLPQYSGWETLVNLSTGVIRNLLYPCYFMFDKEYSAGIDLGKTKSDSPTISRIRPAYQDEIIKEKSQELWNKIENDLFNNIDNCSTKQAAQIKNLFEQIVLLFRERLLSEDLSEPRAITFTISGKQEIHSEKLAELEELLRIAREAQILYDRVSSAKDGGAREVYFVPNRILFPIKGLDVVGQHARVSIKAIELYQAAVSGKRINVKNVSDQFYLDL